MKQILLIIAISFFGLTVRSQERILLLNEGNWQADNSRISYFEDGRIVSNKLFAEKNGYKLGDTPNDIVQISSNLLAIAVNWSNIIQFIRPDGTAVAATEDVPNNRCLATDGRYVYVSSYAHECGSKTFTRGFVAKIDVKTYRVVDAVEVGYEPEGIALYRGHLFVANSGGYAGTGESHDYESTVSVVDVQTMKVVRTVETGAVNLYKSLSQVGRYLLISSAGDYYNQTACSVVLDMDRVLDGASQPCVYRLSTPSTYSCATRDGKFFVISSSFSYLSGSSALRCLTISPDEVFSTHGVGGVYETLPGTIASDIASFSAPYDIYVNPYTGYIYATDAGSYDSAGKLYQWDADGVLIDSWKVYINPSHIIALPPDGVFTSVIVPQKQKCATDNVFDIYGRRLDGRVSSGTVFIQNGKKCISR